MNRRRLLALAGAGGAGLLLGGCSTDLGEPPDDDRGDSGDSGDRCVARSTLDEHRTVGRLPLVYEISQRRTAFAFDDGFHAQLGSWLADYRVRSGLAPPDQVWTYGAYVAQDSGCRSWHSAGRAFDLARLRLTDGSFVSCRYDRWHATSGPARHRASRQYWALAASLHLDFAYVLTYEYNATHANHIHVDNGRSGRHRSTLSTTSSSQLQAVQAICTHLWEEPVEVTGAWDRPTRAAARRVLARIGHGGDLDDSTGAWRAFLRASVPRGGDAG